MIKKILTTSTIATSILFAHPCYSMFCCCGGEDEQEKKASTPLKKHLQQQTPQVNNTSSQRAPLHKNNLEKSSKRQVISHGNTRIEFPKNLSVVSNKDGSTLLALKDIFNIRFFPNYDSAVKTNTDVQALHNIKLILKSKQSLTWRMGAFYKDVREKMEENNKEVTEDIIKCIENIVDEIQAPYPVKFAVDQNTTSCSVLFKIEESALWIKGPGASKKKDPK